MRQVAEHLVLLGHEVTVATRKFPTRKSRELNGVRIEEFELSGNLTYGIEGEIDAYRQFVLSHNCDVIMIKAAQQCTFDALWPILSQIKAQKVFIPCGFSGLYDPAYSDYFRRIPDALRQFNHLIFYASDYRDINFVKKHGIHNFSVLSNGASEVEFSAAPDPLFRKKYNIGEDDFLFLTVGSMTGAKGHFEVAKAFELMKINGKATLILNGNVPCYMPFKEEVLPSGDTEPETTQTSTYAHPAETVGMLLNKYISKITTAIKQGTFFTKSLRFLLRTFIRTTQFVGLINKKKTETFLSIADKINTHCHNKKVLITDLPRPDLIQAFITADLFVFASNIEYSPLVLFESAAAGTPFLSVPVGNAEEIARWTGGGLICPATLDKMKYTKVNPKVLAKYMASLVKKKNLLKHLGSQGRKNWAERFTWEKITREYELIFTSLLDGKYEAR